MRLDPERMDALRALLPASTRLELTVSPITRHILSDLHRTRGARDNPRTFQAPSGWPVARERQGGEVIGRCLEWNGSKSVDLATWACWLVEAIVRPCITALFETTSSGCTASGDQRAGYQTNWRTFLRLENSFLAFECHPIHHRGELKQLHPGLSWKSAKLSHRITCRRRPGGNKRSISLHPTGHRRTMALMENLSIRPPSKPSNLTLLLQQYSLISMSSRSTYWGAGTSIVLRRLPRLVFPPVLIWVLATLGVEHSQKLQDNVSRPALAAALWLIYKLSNRGIKSYRRNQDRCQLGPDVIEIPQVKFKLPWNIDFIPFANEARYVNDAMAPFLDSIGNIFNLTLFGEDFVGWIDHWEDKVSDTSIAQIFTNEPEHVKAMLSTDFANFVKGHSNHEKIFSLLGEGVFNVDGEMWKFHRNMTRPYFSRERITHFELFARHSDSAIAKLLSQPDAVDFQDLVSKFTLDSASEFLFGINVRSLEQPLPLPRVKETEGNTFSAAFTSVQAQAVVRFSYGALWPYMEFFSDRTRRDMRVIDAFIKPILEAKLSLKKKGALEEDEERETLIDHLVKLTDDEKLIKDELFNIMVAGRDTTASTLTFACYMLATNPHILSKLRAEILDHCVSPTVFKSGGKQYFIPAGAAYVGKFLLTPHIILKSSKGDIFGVIHDDAETFDPERWLDDRYKKYVLPNPFIFLPFNAGPRIVSDSYTEVHLAVTDEYSQCLGQQFAYNEISFFLTRLVQRVDQIALAPDAQPLESHPPTSWAKEPGRRAKEKIWPRAHLTLYSHVSLGRWGLVGSDKEGREQLGGWYMAR
ncbi:cytochrome P450 monooxygenase pc-3 [Rhizoctonia solani AG-1 IA]|uniref:Cytochrome P450 monooxygenase pc-3 n=1 Tax=Thanatephorus cucumeris (strain AG1-IA) TaxID=983506 RepID=L8WFD8_THACA|nr:cytochrome P450 monooxygenase pc-3 [Rhizoctonia solani AG-1 IA]